MPLSEAEIENNDIAVALYLMKCCVMTADGMHVVQAIPNPGSEQLNFKNKSNFKFHSP